MALRDDRMIMYKNQSGNVLFLILIAVALFAALAYIVTQSMRGGAGTVNKEKYNIIVNQLLAFPLSVRSGVLHLSTVGGAGAENISFDWPEWGHTNYQHTPPLRDANKIFHPEGAAVIFQRPDAAAMLDNQWKGRPFWGNWLITGATCVPGVGTGDTATCASDPTTLDLVLFLPYVKKELCEQININAEFNLPWGTPPQDDGDAWGANPEFAGTYDNGEAVMDSGELLYRRDSGCFEGGGNPPAGSYHFFMTLLHR